MRVADNQEVAEGAVLFVIDDRDFAAKVAQAEAAVATEEAMVETYGSRLDLQRAMIEEAQAMLESAEADLSAGTTGLHALQRADVERFRQPAAL